MTVGTLRFLVDVNVGRSVVDWLQGEGHDVSVVRDINPRMDDQDILALSISERRVVLTMDKDFGELVYHSGKGHVGVLLLRMGDARRADKVETVRQIVLHHGDELPGHFCVYRSGRLRVR